MFSRAKQICCQSQIKLAYFPRNNLAVIFEGKKSPKFNSSIVIAANPLPNYSQLTEQYVNTSIQRERIWDQATTATLNNKNVAATTLWAYLNLNLFLRAKEQYKNGTFKKYVTDQIERRFCPALCSGKHGSNKPFARNLFMRHLKYARKFQPHDYRVVACAWACPHDITTYNKGKKEAKNIV